MESTLRSQSTVGAALVSACLVAAPPISAPPPTVIRTRNVALTAGLDGLDDSGDSGDSGLLAAWEQVLHTAAANAQTAFGAVAEANQTLLAGMAPPPSPTERSSRSCRRCFRPPH